MPRPRASVCRYLCTRTTQSHYLYFLGKRVLEHILSDTDNKIKQYEDKFEALKSAFQARAILQTEITVLRILDIVGGQGQHISLSARYRFD